MEENLKKWLISTYSSYTYFVVSRMSSGGAAEDGGGPREGGGQWEPGRDPGREPGRDPGREPGVVGGARRKMERLRVEELEKASVEGRESLVNRG